MYYRFDSIPVGNSFKFEGEFYRKLDSEHAESFWGLVEIFDPAEEDCFIDEDGEFTDPFRD